MNDKIGFLWQHYVSVNGWINTADIKATTLLAAEGVILTLLIDNMNEIQKALHISFWASFFAVLGCSFLLLALFFSLECLLPRLKLTKNMLFKARIVKNTPVSDLYFNHIALLTDDEFHDRANKLLADDEAQKQLIHQIWCNSKIASMKFRALAISTWSLAFSIFSAVLSAAIIAFLHHPHIVP